LSYSPVSLILALIGGAGKSRSIIASKNLPINAPNSDFAPRTCEFAAAK